MELTTYQFADNEFNVRGYVRPRNPNFVPSKLDLSRCVDFILKKYDIPRDRVFGIRQRLIDDLYQQISFKVNSR